MKTFATVCEMYQCRNPINHLNFLDIHLHICDSGYYTCTNFILLYLKWMPYSGPFQILWQILYFLLCNTKYCYA